MHLRYDSRTCVTLFAEIGRFCPMLNVSHLIIDVFGCWHFGPLCVSGRMLRGESRLTLI